MSEADNDYVDELLRQSGDDITDSKKGHNRKREKYMHDIRDADYDPTARSSTDSAPEVQRIRTNQHTSTLDMPEMDIIGEEEDEDMNIIEEQEEYDMIGEETDLPQPPDQAPTQAYSLDSSTWWPSGYYFGDGSGGKYSRYPSLTRSGVGVQYVDEDKIPRSNISTPLPGPIKSNNRAELYALWIVVMNIEIVGTIDFSLTIK